jgi:hypothetical protein
MEMSKPKTFVAMLMLDTSIRTRGRNLKSSIRSETPCSLTELGLSEY